MKPLIASTGGDSADYKLPPAETLTGVCVAVLDMGTRTEEFKGESKDHPFVALVWEVAYENEDGEADSCFVVKEYTYYFSPKANLRKLVESWLGRTFTPDATFDVTELLGKPCLVSIQHKDRGGDKKPVYLIDAVAKPPKNSPGVRPSQTPVIVELGDPIPSWVPWIYGQSPADRRARCHELRGQPQHEEPIPEDGEAAEESFPDEPAPAVDIEGLKEAFLLLLRRKNKVMPKGKKLEDYDVPALEQAIAYLKGLPDKGS